MTRVLCGVVCVGLLGRGGCVLLYALKEACGPKVLGDMAEVNFFRSSSVLKIRVVV